MAHHWTYEAELPGGMQHAIQVQTDSPTADFNLLVLDAGGQVIAADRGPEPGAQCVVETPQAQKVTFVVELLSGSGSFSLQAAAQPMDRPRAQASTTTQRRRRPGLFGRRRRSTRQEVPARPGSKPPPLLKKAPSRRRRQRPAQSEPPGATGSALTRAEAEQLLGAHNRWRSRYGVAPLEWSDELAAYAQQWADELEAKGMRMQHRSPNNFGENLYWCSGRPASPDDVVDSWGDEVELYDYAANNWWPDAGHFSQVVWHSTTKVGGGIARLNGQELWVCNYDPRGNWTGQRPYER